MPDAALWFAVLYADTVKDVDILSRRWMFWNDENKGANSNALATNGGDYSLVW